MKLITIKIIMKSTKNKWSRTGPKEHILKSKTIIDYEKMK